MPEDGTIGSATIEPQSANLTGSDFSGASGHPNRTYTMTPAPSHSIVILFIDRTPMHQTDDYTVSGGTLTIVNELDDNSSVDVWWW